MNHRNTFDVVLVLRYFRTASAYLSIIKAMGQNHHIAVLPLTASRGSTPNGAAQAAKTGPIEQVFVQLCRDLGATILEEDVPAECRLLVMQQYTYSENHVESIRESIRARSVVACMSLAVIGLPAHDLFIEQFGISRAYHPDLGLARFLLEERQASERYAGVELIEVGLPFADHPVFDEIDVDWLIVIPTLFSFPSERAKHQFLEDALRLVGSIPNSENIYYKSHNSHIRDYFTPRFHSFIATLLALVPRSRSLLRLLSPIMPNFISSQIEKIVTSMLHSELLVKSRPLAEATNYADLSVELFIPSIRKGLIGGLSNVIWGSAYFGLPYYNCVDPNVRKAETERVGGNSNSASLLDLNLRYFTARYCAGRKDRAEYFSESNVRPSGSQDLIARLEAELRNPKDT